MTYQLRVRFNSNERPWSGTETPLAIHQPKDEQAAIEWARGMERGLGSQYTVELFDDDRRIDFAGPENKRGG